MPRIIHAQPHHIDFGTAHGGSCCHRRGGFAEDRVHRAFRRGGDARFERLRAVRRIGVAGRLEAARGMNAAPFAGGSGS
jgi:hypothetical protein